MGMFTGRNSREVMGYTFLDGERLRHSGELVPIHVSGPKRVSPDLLGGVLKVG